MPNPKVPETVDELLQVIKEARNKLDRIETRFKEETPPPQTPLNERQRAGSAALTAIIFVPQDLWEC